MPTPNEPRRTSSSSAASSAQCDHMHTCHMHMHMRHRHAPPAHTADGAAGPTGLPTLQGAPADTHTHPLTPPHASVPQVPCTSYLCPDGVRPLRRADHATAHAPHAGVVACNIRRLIPGVWRVSVARSRTQTSPADQSLVYCTCYSAGRLSTASPRIPRPQSPARPARPQPVHKRSGSRGVH